MVNQSRVSQSKTRLELFGIRGIERLEQSLVGHMHYLHPRRAVDRCSFQHLCNNDTTFDETISDISRHICSCYNYHTERK